MRRKPVRSLSAFFGEVERTVDAMSPEGDFYLWYRGQANVSWSLTPGVFRIADRKRVREDDFMYDFRRKAWPYLQQSGHEPRTDWEWYFLIQHHGLPTRLLDWSESALVALYFAVRDGTSASNPVVWALDPWALNRVVAKKGDVILDADDKRAIQHLPPPFSKRTLPPYPIALEAPLKSARISHQRGVFTLHGRLTRPIEKYAAIKPHLSAIEVDGSCIDALKRQLWSAGMTETAVFPELSALSRELSEYWS